MATKVLDFNGLKHLCKSVMAKISTIYATKEEVRNKADKATTLSGYGIADAYTKSQVDGLVASAYRHKGTKNTYAELPKNGNKNGDVWNIVQSDAAHGVKAGDNVAWTGSEWDVLAGMVDLSEYLLISNAIQIFLEKDGTAKKANTSGKVENSLTINGHSYDGSEAVNINLFNNNALQFPDGGLLEIVSE